MSTQTPEYQALLKQLGEDLLPAIDAAAKAAVAIASPVAAVFADPVIDEIDAYIAGLLGNPVPKVTAPTDAPSQIASLQQHVAALTVATGAATASDMVTAKQTVQATAAKAKAPAEAVN